MGKTLCTIVGFWTGKRISKERQWEKTFLVNTYFWTGKKTYETGQWTKLGKYILLGREKDIKDKELGITREINTFGLEKGYRRKGTGNN